MRPTFLLLAATLALGCVPAPPAMLVVRHAPDFELSRLAGQRIAVWPIALATFAPEAAEGLTERYGSQDGFTDALARGLSSRLIPQGQAGSLRSDQVIAVLGAAEGTRPLLDPRYLLGDASSSRFTAPRTGLADLAKESDLMGIRFGIVCRDFALDRAEHVFPVGGNHSAGGAKTGYWGRGRLRLTVIDLPAGAVVWEGTLVAHAPLGGRGLQEIEEDLPAQLAEQVFGRRPPARNAPVRCTATSECPRGTCISGFCR